MGKNVVVTGLGLITPLGNDPETILNRITGRRDPFGPPSTFDPGIFSCSDAAEIRNFDPEEFHLDRKTLRIMSRDAIFAAAAARLAVKDSGVKIGDHYKADEVALFGATGLSGIAFEEVSILIKHSATPDGKFDPRLFGEVALKKILPTLSFKILTNMPICFVSIFENIQGMNAIYNPWEGQGARAIAAGIQAIEDGDALCALVGGCEVKTNILGFIGLQEAGYFAVPTENRFIPGEGAGFLILEEEMNAITRKAKIYSRIKPISENYRIFPGTGQNSIFSNIVRSCPRNINSNSPEDKFIEKLGLIGRTTLFPKEIMGDLFAASAAVNVAIGAFLAARGIAGNRVIASCFGWGGEKGMFQLENSCQVQEIRKGSSHETGNPKNTCTSKDIQAIKEIPKNSESLRKRVMVTGIGIVSPIGNSREEFWKNLENGNSGLGPITIFNASSLSVKIGGEVKNCPIDEIKKFFPPSGLERDRKIFLGLTAAREAMKDAGYFPVKDGDCVELSKASLHIGVSLEVFFLEDVTPVIHQPDLSAALARQIINNNSGGFRYPLQTPLDRLGEIIGNAFGVNGGRYTICSACAAGAQVVGEGYRLLRRGDREIAIVGAADSMLNPLGLGGFSLLRALSTENSSPSGACRPFDATRQGTVLGEGAAFLVLETLDHAQKRGANIYAEILGYGSSLDAYRVSDPEPGGRGAVLSMQKALKDADLEPSQIDCVNAHGTGTPKNDAVETAAIKEVLGKRSREIPVHSVKSMTGHLIGASGAVEAATSVLTLSLGVVPPTINLKTPDPECDLDYVPEGKRPFAGKTVLSNSFGFGGQNATLIFGKYPG